MSSEPGGEPSAGSADRTEGATDRTEGVADRSEDAADPTGSAGAATVTPLAAFATNRWEGAVGVTLLLIGAGVISRQASLVLAGAVGVGFVIHSTYGEAPPARLSMRRSLETTAPDPGEEVRVTVRVVNEGEVTLPDLRLVDGVPDALEVTDTPARLATALRPGATASFTYSVRAVRGAHEWEPLRAVTRSPSGARERETRVESATTLGCTPELDAGADLPLRGLTTQYHGRVPTNVGGSGVEFFATREYRRGDPLRRIDWNRRARTGELATLELREERAATVVLVIDAREEAYVASEPEAETAVERSVQAAGATFTALQDGGDRVGLAAVSREDCWLAPGSGTDHAVRARRLLATDAALSPTPSDTVFYPSVWLRRLRRRLSADAQVILFSPLSDRYPSIVARRLNAHGHLVTVVSPDVTSSGTVGGVVARIEREARIRELRGRGVRVIEWRDGPFAKAVAGAQRRWRP